MDTGWLRVWDDRMKHHVARMARFATGVSLALMLPVCAAQAQNAPAGGKERMVVDADQLVYDKDNNTVSAVGSVQILYEGRIIEADKVVYNRQTKRVVAEGNARITEKNGTIITGSKFNLTDDFRDGFIDSLRVENPDKTRFTSPRGERTDGDAFLFEQGTYTACAPCKDNPEKPPLWQVKGSRIIHKKAEQMVYYEDARFEFWGVPIGYLPYFSAPDSTVKRKSGFLSPRIINTNALGKGFSQPYFWNLAPNYDVTLTPTYLSRQGFLGQAEWRHRVLNGSYNIRTAGIFQQDSSAFLVSPLGARNPDFTRPGAPERRDFRGSVESAGKFYINDKWNFGWDLALASDKWFFQNYRIRSESLTSAFFRESTSTVFLNGQTPNAWFDLRGFYIRPQTGYDWQKQQPIVHPVLDYNKRMAGPGILGGEVAVDMNVTSLSREAAQFVQTPRQSLSLIGFNGTLPGVSTTTPYSLYDNCTVYQRGTCLVRGIGGTTSRASLELAWRRNVIDNIGQVWTPYASVRADAFSNSIDNGQFANGTGQYNNGTQINFLQTGQSSYGRVMPAVGLMYKFPFVAQYGQSTHIIEPIAQIVARPNEPRIRTSINEDSQSLVFDDTNLFAWNKFSGYDRVEGGVRANAGVQYTARFNEDANFTALFGQSAHLAGTNSFTQGDIANVGRDSGLQRDRSDYIASASFKPNKEWQFYARGRFDSESFDPRRVDLGAAYTNATFQTGLNYARYERQPELGLDRRREGLYGHARLKILENWYVRGSALADLDKYLLDRETYKTTLGNYLVAPTAIPPVKPNTTPLQFRTFTVGLTYLDECTTFDVSYQRNVADRAAAGAKNDQHTFLMRLELRTLGQINYRQNFGPTVTTDGLQ